MLSRWCWLAMKADSIEPTLSPMPTFSPIDWALRACRVASVTKLPCHIEPCCAISRLWDRAMGTTSARMEMGPMPAAARSPLVRSRNCWATSGSETSDAGNGAGAGGGGAGAGGGGVGAGGFGTVVVVVGFGQLKKHRAWAGAAVTNGATSAKPVIRN